MEHPKWPVGTTEDHQVIDSGNGGPFIPPLDARWVQQYLQAASILCAARMLRDGDAVIRLAAVRNLEDLEGTVVAPLLEQAVEDADGEVRAAARKALDEFRGRAQEPVQRRFF